MGESTIETLGPLETIASFMVVEENRGMGLMLRVTVRERLFSRELLSRRLNTLNTDNIETLVGARDENEHRKSNEGKGAIRFHDLVIS